MAIVLDNTIYSAPVIQERITGGRAQITGTFSMEEANDLAIVLRAGALPAPLKIIQDLTVGPSLGHDSIEKGVQSDVDCRCHGGHVHDRVLPAVRRHCGLCIGAEFALSDRSTSALNATLTLPGSPESFSRSGWASIRTS